MTKLIKRPESGFTVVELLIATAVFGVILLVVTFGLLQVGRMFYKGVTMSRTQEAARAIMDDVAQNIQFSGGDVYPTDEDDGISLEKLCVGNRRYSYIRGVMLSSNPSQGLPHIMVVDNNSSDCQAALPQQVDSVGHTLDPNSRELLSPRMRLSKFTVEPVEGSDNLYKITVRVVHGENDLLTSPSTSPDAGCRNIRLGSQFCAESELQTTVLKRIN